MPSLEAVPYDRPGGVVCGRSGVRPIDLAQLNRQTSGDRALEAEVLGLFLQQALTVAAQIDETSDAERTMLAHGLRGSASAVGATPLAACATAIEARPSDSAEIARLHRLVEEVRDFLAAISR